MTYKIDYKYSAFQDLKHLDEKVAKRIAKDLRKTLSENPRCGEILSRQFKGIFKLSIGDYCAIYSRTRMGALILRIRHGSSAHDR
jgi:mRNA-degrading endonuclease RelE of RelBE toxin-antitoxin system